MISLYNHPKIKAIVNIGHGEGFGLPLFEAAYNELPVIAPAWSGQCDFLFAPIKEKKSKKTRTKPLFAKVEYSLRPVQPEAVWEGVIQSDSMWCYPEERSYKSRMREVIKDYGRFKSQAKTLNKWIREAFTAEDMYKEFVEPIKQFVNNEQEDWLSEIEEIVEDYE